MAWCSICGRDTPEGMMECEGCKKWWEDNPPPNKAQEVSVNRQALADRLMKMAAKRSTETQFGWSHPDCAALEEAARIVRGDPPKKPADSRVIGVLSGAQ